MTTSAFAVFNNVEPGIDAYRPCVSASLARVQTIPVDKLGLHRRGPDYIIHVKMKRPEHIAYRYAPTRKGLQRVARQLGIGERALVTMLHGANIARLETSATWTCSEIAKLIDVKPEQVNAAFSGINHRGKKPRAYVTDGRDSATMEPNWHRRRWRLTARGLARALALKRELETGVATL